jgi:hypothetical protein
MFSIPIYPTDPVERVIWHSNYEQNVMHYIHQIYFEDTFYTEYPQSFVLHTTFRTISQIIKEMRAYITALNKYVEGDKYLHCLVSADQQTDAIRPSTERVKIHEAIATEIYKKYWRLYQEDPPLPLPSHLSIDLEEEQKDFQIV